MRFVAIRTDNQTVEFLDYEGSPYLATELLGLNHRRLDTDTLWRGCLVLTRENGLRDTQAQEFFAIGPKLYQGPAICYAYDHTGKTIPITAGELSTIRKHASFYPNREAVDLAIRLRKLTRPREIVGGRLTWQWAP